jgi:hypothetical protein
MGKWCEVKCNCPDREPIPGSDWFSDDPLRQRKHLTIQQLRARNEWEKRVRGMDKCGHRNGLLLECWPGDLFMIGLALDVAYKDRPEYFEIFRRISNWRNYEDEYLAVSPEEASLWQLEIEQLKHYLSGEEFIGFYERQNFEKALGDDPFLYGDIQKTLEDGMKLCEASATTNNPIEFLW